MKTSSEGFQQCYNAQMAVDGEHQIIVATQVGPQASDQGQLVGMLDEINETFGVEPRPTGGSRRCSDSDDSACEAWRRCAASGTSCAWR